MDAWKAWWVSQTSPPSPLNTLQALEHTLWGPQHVPPCFHPHRPIADRRQVSGRSWPSSSSLHLLSFFHLWFCHSSSPLCQNQDQGFESLEDCKLYNERNIFSRVMATVYSGSWKFLLWQDLEDLWKFVSSDTSRKRKMSPTSCFSSMVVRLLGGPNCKFLACFYLPWFSHWHKKLS